MMKILDYTLDEYIAKAMDFHGHLAPGMICGGFMVDLAFSFLPENGFYDAISETRACIPDSVQILTPCTIGNGWLKIIDTGRFALSFYNKSEGTGVRIALDPERLKAWPEFLVWAMKLKQKKEQDTEKLKKEIIEAGTSVYSVQRISVDLEKVNAGMKKKISLCSSCGESFKGTGSEICSGCSGDLPFSYIHKTENESVKVEESLGLTLSHDMTKIEPGKSKGAAFKKGHKILSDDIDILKSMGKNRIFINSENHDDMIHENDAAIAFADAMAGKNIVFDPVPKEGRIDLRADCDGVLVIDRNRLVSFNRNEEVMCASLPYLKTVKKNQIVAGTRAIPLYIRKNFFDSAMSALGNGGIFSVNEFRKPRAGIIITGTEIASGRIKDCFAPILSGTLQGYGCEIAEIIICNDDRREISDAAARLMNNKAGLIVAAGGLSVDPDDVTVSGLEDAGLTDRIHGAPILPGAMTLIGKIGTSDVIGVPAGALYSKPAAFDILLPLILAGIRITKSELAGMAAGGLLETSKRDADDFVVH